MTVDYAALQATANRTFQEPIQDLIARSNPTLRAITKRAVASDRLYMKWKSASDHAAGGILDGADVTFAGTEATTRNAATLDWKTYIAKFKVNKRTLSQLKANPGQLGMLLKSEIEDAALDLADQISTDLWAGDGSATQITGIQEIVQDANTYAGVDRSVGANANWRGLTVDAQIAGPAPGDLSTVLLDQMDAVYFTANKRGIRENAGMFTGIVTPEILQKFQQLFTTIDLSSLATAHFVNQANATGSLGESTLSWLGVPMMRDAQNLAAASDLANTGRIYMLKMDEIFLATLDSSGEAQLHQTLGADMAPTVDGLNFEIEFLGNKGEAIEGYIKTYLELVCPAPKKLGVALINLDAVLP